MKKITDPTMSRTSTTPGQRTRIPEEVSQDESKPRRVSECRGELDDLNTERLHEDAVEFTTDTETAKLE